MLSAVVHARKSFPRFSSEVKVRNNQRCCHYNLTVEILFLFRLGRRASQQSEYLAAYLSREVSSWQCDTRRYENDFHYPCYSQAKGIFFYNAINTNLVFKITICLAACYFALAQDDIAFYLAYFSILLWLVKLWDVPIGESRLLLH